MLIERDKIENILENLSNERPVFESEADFQFAFAWKIKEKYSNLNIRLEKEMGSGRIDIYIFSNNQGNKEFTAIELKYKTAELKCQIEGEEFDLKNQGAQILGRYDFVKDISRLEKILTSNSGNGIGFAIFLTNDKSYWEIPENQNWKNTQDANFRIHEGRVLEGKLEWQGKPEEWLKGREDPINLKGRYELKWKNYSNKCNVNNNNGVFRYLLVEIKP